MEASPYLTKVFAHGTSTDTWFSTDELRCCNHRIPKVHSGLIVSSPIFVGYNKYNISLHFKHVIGGETEAYTLAEM